MRDTLPSPSRASGAVDATVTAFDVPAPRPGESVSPGLERIAHYRVLRELGAGGMGTVYLAHDERMKRDVALKVMSRHQAASEKAGKRFEQEAWIAGRLDHPSLVKVYERGTWEDLSYFSMEFVDGGALSDVVASMRRSGRDERLGLEFGTSRYVHWAIGKVVEAARGLDFAHRQGVVHRDVKPMNLLLHRELGAVKIADFGLAIDAGATRMTTAGTVMGTISFMAPEQIRGEQDKIDARTDVYALGVTLFELLTLELPFTGQTQQIYMSQVLTSEARRASKLNAQVSRDLETVLRKAMEKERRDRYQTAAALADDLENVLHLRPIQARPTGPVKRAAKFVRRKPIHAALIATLLVAVPTAGVLAARAIQARIAERQARIADLLDEARWLEERQRYAEAIERAAAVLAFEPANTMALRHRAMSRFMMAPREAEAATARKLREQALEDVSRVIAARPDASWAHAMKAFMLTEMGLKEEARSEEARAAQFRAAIPSDEDVREEARLADAVDDRARALELYSELIRRHPDSVRAISSRALIYEELEDPDNAFIDYRVAVGLDPSYELALIDLARMSLERDSFGDARAYLDRAAALGGELGFADEIRGLMLAKQGMAAKLGGDVEEARRLFEEAEQAARAALARSDKVLWAQLNFAQSLHERGRLTAEPDSGLIARAVEMYTKVLDRFPTPPAGGQDRDVYVAALNNTCDAQIELRRLEEALATCFRITQLQPKNATAYYNLAGVYALLGREEDALQALERDVALGDKDWEYLAADQWFGRLRGHVRFEAILSAMRQRKAGISEG